MRTFTELLLIVKTNGLILSCGTFAHVELSLMQMQVATQEENRKLMELQTRITGIVQTHRERLNMEMTGAVSLHDHTHERYSDERPP